MTQTEYHDFLIFRAREFDRLWRHFVDSGGIEDQNQDHDWKQVMLGVIPDTIQHFLTLRGKLPAADVAALKRIEEAFQRDAKKHKALR